MIRELRVVPDTNVLIAAQRSTSPTSPNKEFFQRWYHAQFDLLFSDDTLHEYVEKLAELGVTEQTIKKLVQAILVLGVEVEIVHFHLRYYPEDPDDIAFILCAVNGDATHILSHDRHLLQLAHRYPFTICTTIEFLLGLQQA
ncbi:MAG: putative toxin-antitoxin system toxin component, PIN family [Caldilineaceae bacterium]|nr:putative toxin-antitoxin system toxin component, PIN family [Caldilineaceae bacterium]